MKKFRIILVLASIILFGSIAFPSQIHTANAATSCNLSAYVDQSSYNWGDTITLSFNTPSDAPVSKVVITSNDPTGHVPYISTYYINPGYSYTIKIPTASSDWYASGNYYIKLQLLYPSGNVAYCSGVTPYFTFNAVTYQAPSATPPSSIDYNNCVSWHWHANSGSYRWDTYITNNCDETITYQVHEAWDASTSHGYNQVWGQSTSQYFTLGPGQNTHEWQYVSPLPPSGQMIRSENDLWLPGDTLTAYGNWFYN